MSRWRLAIEVLLAIVLAIAVAYGLLSLAFSGWGDPPLPTPTETVAIHQAVG